MSDDEPTLSGMQPFANSGHYDESVPDTTTPIKVRLNAVDVCSFGDGGWVRWQHRDVPFPVFLRVEHCEGTNHLQICELYIGGGGRITGDLLRMIDLARLEVFINDEPNMRARLELPGADLKRLIGYFCTDWGRPPKPRDWVFRSFQAQLTGSGEPQAPEIPLTEPFETRTVEIDATLNVPSLPRGRAYPDSFYSDVADLYRTLARLVRSPAGLIADANHVPVGKVHEWVRGARQRGFLPPGPRPVNEKRRADRGTRSKAR